MFHATLENYEVVECQDGFYALREVRGKSVNGAILVLDSSLLLKADQWEEVPIYERERTVIKTDFGEVMAWYYNKSIDEAQVKIVDPSSYSSYDETDLKSILDDFCLIRGNQETFYDIYYIYKADGKRLPPNFVEFKYGNYPLKIMLEAMTIGQGQYLIASMALPILEVNTFRSWFELNQNALEDYAELSSGQVLIANDQKIPFDKTYFFRRRMFLHAVKRKLSQG